MQPQRSAWVALTGAALIAFPLLAVLMKLLSPGWMVVMLLFGPILVLMAGYALQVVIAVQGFVSERARFAAGARKIRANIAAWVTSLGVVGVGVFLPDGGDSDRWGSTFQVWLGVLSAGKEEADAIHEATDLFTNQATTVSVLLWLGGFIWLVVEWIVALVASRRLRRLAQSPLGQQMPAPIPPL